MQVIVYHLLIVCNSLQKNYLFRTAHFLTHNFIFTEHDSRRLVRCGSARGCRGGGGLSMSEGVYMIIGLAGKKIMFKGAFRKAVDA